MPLSFLHGFEFIETALLRPIQMVRSSIIGLVGTAPKGPINEVTLIKNRSEAVATFSADEDFTIPSALDAIFDQGDYIGFVVVVNVLDPTTHKSSVANEEKTFDTVTDKLQLNKKWVAAEVVKNSEGTVTYVNGTDYTIDYATGVITRLPGGAITSGQTVKISYDWADPSKVLSSDIVGGVNQSTGKNEGIEALNDTSSIYGFAPKILIAPQYSSSKTVMDALLAKAETFRSMAIADSAAGATIENAIAYRNQFDNPRAIITYPLLKKKVGEVEKIVPFSPYLAGVMSRTDNMLGFWYSPSNKSILGIEGLERPIPYLVFSSPNSTANYLNEMKIVTAIHHEGYRVWGNRSATTDSAWHYISVRRQFDIIEDSIEIATLHLLDRPINKAFFEDLQDSVQAFLNSLIGRQAIIDGKIRVLPEDNPPAQIANGQIMARIDITPTYPAERIIYNVTLEIEPLKKLFE